MTTQKLYNYPRKEVILNMPRKSNSWFQKLITKSQKMPSITNENIQMHVFYLEAKIFYNSLNLMKEGSRNLLHAYWRSSQLTKVPLNLCQKRSLPNS